MADINTTNINTVMGRASYAAIGSFMLAALLTPQPAKAEMELQFAGQNLGELSGSAAFMTDYIFYGLGYSDNGPAAMATMAWAGPEIAGIAAPSASIYGINVDGVGGGLELGYSFGLEKTIAQTSLYLGTTYYHYPANNDAKAIPAVEDDPETTDIDESADAVPAAGDGDFLELQIALSQALPVADMGATVYYAYSGDGYGNSGPYHLTSFQLGLPLEQLFEGLSASALIGYFDGREIQGGTEDYWYWDIGLALEVQQLAFGLNYIETDLPTSPTTDARVLFSVSYGF